MGKFISDEFTDAVAHIERQASNLLRKHIKVQYKASESPVAVFVQGADYDTIFYDGSKWNESWLE